MAAQVQELREKDHAKFAEELETLFNNHEDQEHVSLNITQTQSQYTINAVKMSDIEAMFAKFIKANKGDSTSSTDDDKKS